jgi:hypothetical protein
MSLMHAFSCYGVWLKAQHISSLDPKWCPDGIICVYIGPSWVDKKRGYAILTEDCKVHNCMSANFEDCMFPYQPVGDQRISGNYFKAKDVPEVGPIVAAGVPRFDPPADNAAPGIAEAVMKSKKCMTTSTTPDSNLTMTPSELQTSLTVKCVRNFCSKEN